MKKAGPPSIGKSGAPVGKTAKVGTTLSSGGKLPTLSTSKTYGSPSYSTPKKSSTTFGIIWLPGRKKRKYKDAVYNSHKDDRSHNRAPSMYNFMAGDSSNQHTLLKQKDEESNLLVTERTDNSSLVVASVGAGAVAASDVPTDIINANTKENQFINRDEEDNKECSDDSKPYKKSDNENYPDKEDKTKTETQSDKDKIINFEKEKLGDNVDSVYLRPPPPHKTRSTVSTAEEEDCGIKCLYYTLQCCDCVLM